MSHVSTYKGKVKDLPKFQEACRKLLGVDCVVGNHIVEQFGSNRIDAVASVRLPGWAYDIAIDKDGHVLYDHYGSATQGGKMETLGELMQTYNEEVIMDSAWCVAENVYTEENADGSKTIILEYC